MTRFTEWVASRQPPLPAALADRLHVAILQFGEEKSEDISAAAARTAVHLLERLLGEGEGERSEAIDLLAADTLMTYAFEAATEHPATIIARARDAMASITRAVDQYAASPIV